MRGRFFVRLIRAAGALAAVIALSCGSGDERGAVDEPAESPANAALEEPVSQGQGADVVIQDVIEIPAEFPKDIPLYPDAEPAGVLENPADGEQLIAISSPASVQEFTTYYGDALGNRDWVIDEQHDLGEQSVIIAKKDGRTVQVLILSNGLKTTATIKAIEAE